VIRWWVALWDRREVPDLQALIRAGVGFVLLADFLTTYRLGLVIPLMAGPDGGGLVSVSGQEWARWVGTDERAAWLLWAGLTASAFTLTIGLSTRASAFLLMVLSAQWALLLPDGDRAIDMLLRNVLLVLALSSAGRTWSVDAWVRTGSLRGDGEPVPAWPRYVIVLQIVLMYFTAGVQKYGQHWWPWGGWSALFVILQDWAVASRPFGWLRDPPWYALTQLSTFVTMIFQWSYPVVLAHYFPPAGPPGRFRRVFARYRLHWAWIAVGAWFHLALAATMELGIFPWGMLALYPAFLHPDELPRWLRASSAGRTITESPARTPGTSPGSPAGSR
jgi:hypothetical protein